jgi:hypothetical protein
MFVCPAFGSCILSPFWCLELQGSSNLEIICTSVLRYLHVTCFYDILYILSQMLLGSTLFVHTELTDNLVSS